MLDSCFFLSLGVSPAAEQTISCKVAVRFLFVEFKRRGKRALRSVLFFFCVFLLILGLERADWGTLRRLPVDIHCGFERPSCELAARFLFPMPEGCCEGAWI